MQDFLRDIILGITLFLSSLLPQNEYIEGSTVQPISLNPLKIHKSGIEKTITNLIFRKLFQYDHEGNIVPDLVDDWEISEDGLSYTIHLKKKQYFHDGREITANDILYTASKSNRLNEIAFDKLGQYSVRFFLPNKYSPFLSLLNIPVLSAHYGDTMEDFKPIGSGDFRVSRVVKKGSIIKKINLVTDDNKYNIKRLTIKFYDKESDLPIAAKLGEIDGFSINNGFVHQNFT